MNLFITQQENSLKQKFFPKSTLEELNLKGNLKVNQYNRVMTEVELSKELKDVDVCIALAWGGCPRFTREVLDNALNLKLIVTPGASVATFITEAVYERGIKVCSANSIMARYVAEGTLAYILAAQREIVMRNNEIREGIWNNSTCQTLIGAKVGLIGLGTVGRFLLEFLRPFGVSIKLYDPYIKPVSLRFHSNVTLCSLEEALSGNDVVSLHASQTEETFHMLNKERLSLLKDGTLLINTSRGSLIDEPALIAELRTGRIHTALDVYEVEPLPIDNKLKKLENAILMPHIAGMVHLEKFTFAMLEEIERFQLGEKLWYEIPVEQYRLMTR
ncbi:hydroxyacid dehydrogenase [Paenibacillus psychroresistens]|uniref:hydroxyacid dehydrogenase n=1 Tax=Paenibacillus psychroresistens TaxID=1778678 RepID=UPI001390F715|nr:hydroxyacid dehydrogenase [Paenibacillus psychroresistens]